jgi:lipoprotein-anchoring transpeptidase ErfK/SrfK
MKSPILIIAAGLIALTGTAMAGERYHQRPPVVLSPDLTGPWVTQLRQQGTAYGAGVIVRGAPKWSSARPTPTQRKPVRTASAPATAAKPAFDPAFLPTTVDYATSQPAGSIVIDTPNRFLYLVLGDGKARRYGVGVGKPGFEWAGTHSVTRKAEWPDWRPPKEMIAREAKKGHYLPEHMAGGPANPLGARAMYIGSTLYRIHGTNQPWTIGGAVSSGCIRMRNEDVMDLYDRVSVGARVVVI